tara:strand:+ start:828 stop:1472 length:645 start_codon:yes stop_codon:yes gene_type:complete
MANYAKVVAWASKDSLADTDVNKIISGDDFNTEFSAIEDAIETKAEINGAASEAFQCKKPPTAADSTTKTPNTEWVQELITATKLVLYPVGSIYINAAVATNPATLLGFGVWTAYGAGRVMVGKNSSGTFDTLNEEQGSETQTLSVANLPSHTHANDTFDQVLRKTGSNTAQGIDSTSGEPDIISSVAMASVGSGTAHNNIQPSITVYMWKRAS